MPYESKNHQEDRISEDECKLEDISIILSEKKLHQPISTAEILALRERTLAQYRFRIGLLSSTLLEDPQTKVSK